MDYLELAKARHSIRKFTDEPVSQEDLDKIIVAANAACVVYSMHLETTSLGLGSVFMWGALESAREYPRQPEVFYN